MEENEKIFKAAEKQRGITVAEVQQKLAEAIEEAYKKPNGFAKTVPRKNAVPTVEELIVFITALFVKK